MAVRAGRADGAALQIALPHTLLFVSPPSASSQRRQMTGTHQNDALHNCLLTLGPNALTRSRHRGWKVVSGGDGTTTPEK